LPSRPVACRGRAARPRAPAPTDLKARILSTNIDLDEGTCSIELALSAAGVFGLGGHGARTIIGEVGAAVATWRETAAQVAGTDEINDAARP
jgi:serine/threonine-protein kinase HipA